MIKSKSPLTFYWQCLTQFLEMRVLWIKKAPYGAFIKKSI